MATNLIKNVFIFPMFETEELAKKPCKEVFGLEESRQWAISTVPAMPESKKQLENRLLNSNRVRTEHFTQLNNNVSSDKFRIVFCLTIRLQINISQCIKMFLQNTNANYASVYICCMTLLCFF